MFLRKAILIQLGPGNCPIINFNPRICGKKVAIYKLYKFWPPKISRSHMILTNTKLLKAGDLSINLWLSFISRTGWNPTSYHAGHRERISIHGSSGALSRWERHSCAGGRLGGGDRCFFLNIILFTRETEKEWKGSNLTYMLQLGLQKTSSKCEWYDAVSLYCSCFWKLMWFRWASSWRIFLMYDSVLWGKICGEDPNVQTFDSPEKILVCVCV